MSTGPMDIRAVGRQAVREQLARLGFGLFCDRGFDAVTFEDLAAAAGVSRSTFLRHFGSKEDVVLFVFDPFEDAMVEVASSRPTGEIPWQVLRRAVDPVVEFFTADVAEGLAILRLIGSTPALCGRLRNRSAAWSTALANATIDPSNRRSRTPSLAESARAAAAIGCLTAALEHWVSDNARHRLDRVVDDAFAALTPSGS